MLRFGPADGPVVVAAPALFEEGNRTRAFLVRILRLLAGRGIAGVLPDLPGQGESSVSTVDARLEHWRAALAAAVASQRDSVFALALRGGVLLDGEAEVRGRYHIAPTSGTSILQDLERARRAASGWTEPTLLKRWTTTAAALPPLFAGNHLHDFMIFALNDAEPSVASRTVRLDTDPRPADLKLPGRPLWRASEPDVDEALAAALADDVAAWIRACAA